MHLAKLLGPELKLLLKEDPEQVRELLEEIHPEDLADLISELEPDEAAELLARLPADEAAPIFERLEGDEQEEIAVLMPPESVAQIASEMASDDRADLFSALPEDMGDAILEKLVQVDPEAADDVREIEKWPETSAGHLMTTDYVSVPPTVTVATAIQAVREHAENHNESIYNVYAIEADDTLVGIASLRDLLLARPEQKIADIFRTNIISVRPSEDQEEVARRMAKYDLNVMPVVDESGKILGVITIDDIIDVLTQEQTEDVQKLGAIEPLDLPYFRTSFGSLIKKRGMWLAVLFVTEFFTTSALRHYEWVYGAIHGAMFYLPLMVSAGGNSGAQSSTLIIRGLSVGEITLAHWWRILLREAALGLVLGLGLALVGFARVISYSDQHIDLALTVAATLVGIVMAGCTVGSMMPLILKRVGFDPATSSGPAVASLVDVLGIVIFAYVAQVTMAAVLAGAH